MAALRDKLFGDSDPAVRRGAYLPFKLMSASLGAQAQSLTVVYGFKAVAPGRIRHLSVRADITGTVTIDLKKNGASVLVAAKALTDNTTLELEGLGTDATGALQNFDTDTAAHLTELYFEDGDEWTLEIITAAASTIVSGQAELSGEQKQKRLWQ